MLEGKQKLGVGEFIRVKYADILYTEVSSLSKQSIEKCCLCVGMSGFSFCERDFELIWKIWTFHGIFDAWVNVKVVLKMIKWAVILSWIKFN